MYKIYSIPDQYNVLLYKLLQAEVLCGQYNNNINTNISMLYNVSLAVQSYRANIIVICRRYRQTNDYIPTDRSSSEGSHRFYNWNVNENCAMSHSDVCSIINPLTCDRRPSKNKETWYCHLQEINMHRLSLSACCADSLQIIRFSQPMYRQIKFISTRAGRHLEVCLSQIKFSYVSPTRTELYYIIYYDMSWTGGGGSFNWKVVIF